MLKTESLTINNKEFKRTYSDAGYKIRQIETGIVYDDAMDVPTKNYTYEETEELIEQPEKPEQEV